MPPNGRQNFFLNYFNKLENFYLTGILLSQNFYRIFFRLIFLFRK